MLPAMLGGFYAFDVSDESARVILRISDRGANANILLSLYCFVYR